MHGIANNLGFAVANAQMWGHRQVKGQFVWVMGHGGLQEDQSPNFLHGSAGIRLEIYIV